MSTVSHAQNCGEHYHHAGACGLPPRGQSTNYGMYPAASSSMEHQGVEDFLPVC
jgi:hypothetical protein